MLSLLRDGHTAKSIAAATGLSVHAVNERLRAARRKVGVGSSRELARLIGSQENRDDEIGVVSLDRPVDASAIGASTPGLYGKGMAVMLAGLGVVGVGAVGY